MWMDLVTIWKDRVPQIGKERKDPQALKTYMLPTKTPKTKSPKNLDGVIDATKKTKFTFQVRKKKGLGGSIFKKLYT